MYQLFFGASAFVFLAFFGNPGASFGGIWTFLSSRGPGGPRTLVAFAFAFAVGCIYVYISIYTYIYIYVSKSLEKAQGKKE